MIKWFGVVSVLCDRNNVWIQMSYLDSGLRSWNPQDPLRIDSFLLQKRQQLQRERERKRRERHQQRVRHQMIRISCSPLLVILSNCCYIQGVVKAFHMQRTLRLFHVLLSEDACWAKYGQKDANCDLVSDQEKIADLIYYRNCDFRGCLDYWLNWQLKPAHTGQIVSDITELYKKCL